MSSGRRPVLMANVPGNLDEMATKAAFNVYYEVFVLAPTAA